MSIRNSMPLNTLTSNYRYLASRGRSGELGSASGKDGYKQLNQVLSVLKFFATSNTPDLALKTKA